MAHQTRRTTRARALLTTAIVTGSIGFVGAAQAVTPIDTGQPFYLQSDVGTTVLPDFQGGTLQIDQSGVTDGNAYNVENFPTNTIDEFSNTITFTGGFSGAGPLLITDSFGGGTMIVTGGSFIGGALTIDSNATLQWGNGTGGAFFLGTGDTIVDNGALIMDFGGGAVAGTISISGSGSVFLNSGAFGDSSASTYTGLTAINASTSFALTGAGSISSSSFVAVDGDLDISGTTAGTSLVNLAGTGTVDLGSKTLTLTSASTEFDGVIGGTGGGLTIAGGTEILGGTNTFTGTTTINGGATLVLGNGGTTGTVAGNIVDNGLLQFNYGGPVTISNALSGAGAIEIVAGTVIETTASFVGGTVTIDSGATLSWGNGAGPAFLIGGAGVTDDGTFVMDFGSGGGVSTSLVISGAGDLEVKSGTFGTTATNTYGGTTTIDTGATLQLGDGFGVTGSVAGAITDNGTLKFDYNGPVTVANALTGSGSVEVVKGTVIITGIDIVGGTVTVDSGATLQWGNGGGAAALIGGGFAVTDNGALVMDFGGASGLAGPIPISGTGTMEVKTGLFEDFGAITITGATTIDLGATLQLGTSGSTSGTVAGPIVDDGLLKFSYTGAPVTEGSAISGSGDVEVTSGTVVVTNTSFVGGNVTIDSGATLQWGNHSLGYLIGSPGVVDNGALVLDFGGSGLGATIAISGSGTFEIKSGSLNNAGISTYTGSTTIDAGAILVLTAPGSISNSSVVADDGIFDVAGTTGTSIINLTGSGKVSLGSQTLTITAASGTFSGVLADGGIFFPAATGGGLTIASGTETLSGTNTFTGTTTINLGATLELGAGGTTGTVAGPITDNGLLKFNYGGAVTEASLITGSGSVEVVAGTLIETSSSFVGGSVTIDSGATLQWGNGHGAFLTGGGNVVIDNGALVMNFGSDGVGGVTPIQGTGTVTLVSGGFSDSGTSTYTGATTINAGNAYFALLGAGSISNSSVVTVNGTFDISGITASTAIRDLAGSGSVKLGSKNLAITNAAGTFSGVISDGGLFPATGGSLTLFGGTLTLSGANTYTGTTSVNGGTLAAGAANTFSPGSILAVFSPGAVTLNSFNQTVAGLAGTGNIALGSATLTVNDTVTTNLAGVISGSGGLIKTGAGTQILSGVNTYTGPTAINAGTLQMGVANALSASTDVTVASGATFNLASFNQTIGSLAGAGSVTLGSATLNTNGDNATTTFSGAISGTGGLTKTGTGMLSLTGVSAYTGVTLVNGGVLSVNGTLASAVTVNATATLQGNGTIGGLTVNANGTVAPGNSIGTLHVAGNVNFGPGSIYQVEVNAAGQSDLIAATGTVTLGGGTVQALPTTGNYALSTTYIILTGSSVTGTFASVTSSNAFFFPSLVYKPAEVDLVLKSAAAFAQTPNQIAAAAAIQAGLGPLATAIGLLPVSQIPAAFDATSGEIHASMRSALLENGQTLRDTVLSRLHDAHDTAVWGRLFGNWGEIDGDGNAARLDTNFSGLTIGADTPLDGGFRVGAEAGYGQVAGFIGGSRSSHMESDSFHAGVYGGYATGPFSLNGGLIGSWGTVRTLRAVRFGTLSDTDRATQDSTLTQAFAEAAYDCPLGSVDLSPFFNAGWIEANTGAFRESGGVSALSGSEAVSDQTFTTLGVRLSTDIALPGGGDIAPSAMVGWQHAYRGLVPARAVAFENTGVGFTVLGVPLDEDQAVIDAGVTAHPGPGTTITFGYQGILSDRVTDNGLQLSAAWNF